MGGVVAKLFPKTRELRVLMMGLDAAGKTTALYKMRLGEVITTIPTIGFNVETVAYKNIEFVCWDVGGKDKIRPLWRHYYQNTQAVIFVVDSHDVDRIEMARQELATMLAEDELRDSALLVLANKQDLEDIGALSPEEVEMALGLWSSVPHRETLTALLTTLEGLPPATMVWPTEGPVAELLATQDGLSPPLPERYKRLRAPAWPPPQTDLGSRRWLVQGSSGCTGNGLYEGLEWMAANVPPKAPCAPKAPPVAAQRVNEANLARWPRTGRTPARVLPSPQQGWLHQLKLRSFAVVDLSLISDDSPPRPEGTSCNLGARVQAALEQACAQLPDMCGQGLPASAAREGVSPDRQLPMQHYGDGVLGVWVAHWAGERTQARLAPSSPKSWSLLKRLSTAITTPPSAAAVAAAQPEKHIAAWGAAWAGISKSLTPLCHGKSSDDLIKSSSFDVFWYPRRGSRSIATPPPPSPEGSGPTGPTPSPAAAAPPPADRPCVVDPAAGPLALHEHTEASVLTLVAASAPGFECRDSSDGSWYSLPPGHSSLCHELATNTFVVSTIPASPAAPSAGQHRTKAILLAGRAFDSLGLGGAPAALHRVRACDQQVVAFMH
eukprot:gene8554-1530_t